jgi:hypothetical protein
MSWKGLSGLTHTYTHIHTHTHTYTHIHSHTHINARTHTRDTQTHASMNVAAGAAYCSEEIRHRRSSQLLALLYFWTWLQVQRTMHEGEEAVLGTKLTGDPNVPAGSPSFRVKVSNTHTHTHTLKHSHAQSHIHTHAHTYTHIHHILKFIHAARTSKTHTHTHSNSYTQLKIQRCVACNTTS